MASSLYDRSAIKAELVKLGEQTPRQASALARHVGVSAASAARWLSPDHRDVPEPERWGMIEQFFDGLGAGDLARIGQLQGQPPSESLVAQLASAVTDLAARVERLERQAAGEPLLRAANTGKRPSGKRGPQVNRPSPEAEPNDYA